VSCQLLNKRSVALVAQQDSLPYTLVEYWSRKASNPTFRDAPWGGNRSADGGLSSLVARELIWELLQTNNQPTLRELSEHLREAGVHYQRSSVSVLLKKWRWSFKIPTVEQIHKYTPTNVQRYIDVCQWYSVADLHRLKFVDEVHFDPRGTVSSVQNMKY
jgi:transposase